MCFCIEWVDCVIVLDVIGEVVVGVCDGCCC